MPVLRTVLYTVLLIAASTCALGALYVGRQRSRTAAASPLALLLAAAAFYCGGSALEIAVSTLPAKLLAVAVEYVGVAPLPAFWVLFAWRSLHGRRPLPRATSLALFVFPAITLVLNWTNGLHHLYYTATTLDSSGPFPMVHLARGPWYWVNTVFLLFSFVAGNLLLLLRLLRAPAAERVPAALTMAGSLAPWAGYLLYVTGASPLNLDLSPLAMPVGALLFAVGLFRYRMLELVPAARERVFESMNDGVIVVDAQQRIVDYNMAAAAVCRRLDSRAIGAPASEALADLPVLTAAIRAGAGSARLDVPAANGTATYDVRLQPVRDRRGRTVGFAVVLTDITDQVILVRKLQDLATIDELTGLANRRQFFELGHREAARARREQRPISVAIMDLDHFKNVNDEHGHAVGDAALRIVAHTCRAGVRLTDLVGRYGGEELAFVFPEAGMSMAAEVAERLRSSIASRPIVHADASITVTASFGVASSGAPAEADLEALLQAADRALYRAKSNGRNRVELACVGD